MSEAKHTPGPWEAVGNLVRSPMYQPDGLPRGVLIVECMDGYCQPFTEEAKANACLIAAAPELLEALVDIMFRHVPFSDKRDYANKARAVIAKATGQPHD